MDPKKISVLIDQICQEKKISREAVIKAIEKALAIAYRKDYGNKMQNIKVDFNLKTGLTRVYDVKTVVEDLSQEESAQQEKSKEKRKFNPRTEIQLSDAKKIKKNVKVGDEIITELPLPTGFGRIAAQTAKQVIIQNIREAERQTLYEKYKKLEHSVIDGVIQRREGVNLIVDLGDTNGILIYEEQIPEERYWPGEKLKFYLLTVKESLKGPIIVLSRRHPDIVKALFISEVPEIAEGSVEIKAIVREAGYRSKVAVVAKDKNIDPVGACIGQRGTRIQTIIGELGGEKVDIIHYSDNPEEFIVNSIAPAEVTSIKLNKKEKKAKLKIKSNQLSLAYGRKKQNLRLASELTGWKIEIEEEKLKKSKNKKNKKEK
ncbi:transcription termination/antitermination protein NusA [bacterium]|nr:transcription termination/antitermination protein NusA [bacterium]